MSATKKKPSDFAPQFLVRMPDGMREQIRKMARANKRSMNSQIITMLSETIERGDVNSRLAKLEAEVFG